MDDQPARCVRCDTEYVADALCCPHCGAPNPRVSLLAHRFGMVVVTGMMLAVAAVAALFGGFCVIVATAGLGGSDDIGVLIVLGIGVIWMIGAYYAARYVVRLWSARKQRRF